MKKNRRDATGPAELRRQAEEALARYTDLYEHAPVGYLTLGQDGEILQINLTGAHLLGLERSRLVNKRLGMLLSADSRAALNEFVAKVFEGQTSQTCEVTACPFGASEIALELTATVADEGRECRAVVKDISELKRSELAQRQSETRFRAIASHTPDHILMQDRDLRYTLVINPQLGLTEAGMLGKTDRDFLEKEDAEKLSAVKRKVLQTGKPAHIETSLVNAQGQPEIFEGDYIPVADDSGKPDGLIGYFRNVTERKRADDALRQERDFSASLLATAQTIVLVLDVEGRVVHYNPYFEAICGYPIGETKGRDWFSTFLPPATRPRTRDFFLRAIEDIQTTGNIDSIVCRDGRRVAVEWYDKTLKDTNGRTVGLLCIGQDVTARAQAEEALRSSERKFRALAENSVDTIMRFDRQHRHLYVNPAVEQATGIAPELFIGKTHRELEFPEPLCALWQEAIEKVFKTGSVNRIDFELPTGVWIDWLLAPETDAQGEVVAVITAARDVSERVAAERELRAREKRFRDLVEMLPEAIFETDAGGKLVFVNKRALATFGYGTADVADGLHARDVIAPLDRERAQQNMQRVLRGEDLGANEYLMQTRDGHTFPALVRSVLIGDQDQPRGLLGLVVDISEHERAEAEREVLEEKLRMAQKMESIGRLAGGVAHDFNNLLSVIIGQTGFALEDLPDGAPARDDLLEVEAAAQRAAALTRQLLAFSRKQVLQPVPLDLNTVVSGMATTLHRVLGEDIEVVQVPGADLPPVMADPGQFEQVIMNLAVNARDAMPTGGTLRFETANVELDQELAVHDVSVPPGRYVVLSTADTGCGMDAPTVARLFEPYFTTKEKGKGTGLGLSTVYGVVKQSNGYISVDTTTGKGTTFKIYLPATNAAAVVVRRPQDAQQSEGDETILLVEDETALLRVARRSLAAAGYQVLVAADGDEALRVSAQFAGDIHLLVTDVVMPRMSGGALAEQLTKNRPTTRVLFMSGYTDDAIGHHGVLEAGARFLGKPFTAADLTHKVREVLDQPM